MSDEAFKLALGLFAESEYIEPLATGFSAEFFKSVVAFAESVGRDNDSEFLTGVWDEERICLDVDLDVSVCFIVLSFRNIYIINWVGYSYIFSRNNLIKLKYSEVNVCLYIYFD